MGWIETLYNTYNYLEKLEKKREGCAVGLLPPAVIMQKANIEVTIDDKGKFLRAKKIEDKKDSETYIPCTEESASRTSGVAPHALFDQIKYVAGDYEYEFPNEKESNDANKKYFQPYIKALKKWVESEYSDDVIKVIYKYLLGATLARDLVCSNVLDNLKEPNPGKANSNKKEDHSKNFVRFAVEKEGKTIKFWEQKDMLKRYSEYYMSTQRVSEGGEFCYVAGIGGYMAKSHGKYIRCPGDGAKLISSNDKKNFTFRGRFRVPEEAVCISYEVSEKSHSALRYIIKKNKYMGTDGQKVIVWGDGEEIADDVSDKGICEMFFGESSLVVRPADIENGFAKELYNSLYGYYSKLEMPSKINLMIIDSATTGRMAVQYFKSFEIDEYIDKISKWREDLSISDYHNIGISGTGETNLKAPSIKEILTMAFGGIKDGKIEIRKSSFISSQHRKVLSCISDGGILPINIMRGALRNTIKMAAISKKYNKWEKVLRNTCSVIKKYYIDKDRNNDGGIYMSIDQESKDRSYLFGRLLAVADKVEEEANFLGEKRRLTAAKRYMNIFAKKPSTTWVNIHNKLSPCWSKLSYGSRIKYSKLIDKICELFEKEDFERQRALEPSFLLAYYHQRGELYQEQNKDRKGGNENVEE